jgi:predicted DNA-binding protein YlxM (UPF0122 family)
MLEDYEQKLLLFDKFQKRQKLLQKLKERIERCYGKDEELFMLIEELEKLE